MGLISTDSEDVEINLRQSFVHVMIDDHFIYDAESLDQVDPLLGRIQDFRIRFGPENILPVLNSDDQIVAQLFCIFKEAQMTEMEIVKYTDSNNLFHHRNVSLFLNAAVSGYKFSIFTSDHFSYPTRNALVLISTVLGGTFSSMTLSHSSRVKSMCFAARPSTILLNTRELPRRRASSMASIL